MAGQERLCRGGGTHGRSAVPTRLVRKARRLLRRRAAGEAVAGQVDWQHVVEEIEDLGRNMLSTSTPARNRPLDRAPDCRKGRAKEFRARRCR
jgi:hypothetical protein